VARPRYPKSGGPLPPPLPPESRTVGQLVGETLKLYGDRWPVGLAIGLPAAILSSLATGFSRAETLAVIPLAGGLAVTLSFLIACAVVSGVSLRAPEARTAFLVGIVIFLPFPFLVVLFVVPGLAWFALIGLAVPATLAEGLSFRQAFRRGIELGRADFGHALGGLVTLTILVFVTQIAIAQMLQSFADNSGRIAAFLAGLVLSPVIFLGAALLYIDQRARVGRSKGDPPTEGDTAK
jgi:hypothetical protein